VDQDKRRPDDRPEHEHERQRGHRVQEVGDVLDHARRIGTLRRPLERGRRSAND
jgi:hypothetical protein